MLEIVLVAVLLVVLLGGGFGYYRGGYYAGPYGFPGGVGLVIVVLLIFWLLAGPHFTRW